MTKTVLVLGASGRFGRHAAKAFADAGWQVRAFNRATESLWEACWGADVIVNGWNQLYPAWAAAVPEQTRQLIEVAEACGALVVVPGNVYPFGEAAPARLAADVPHTATNPLGRVRREMEAAWKASPARVLIIRAGDFLDSEASGNWFDRILAKDLAKGRLAYPGPADRPHAWAWLPDVARAVVELAEKADRLERFIDLPFPGYTLTGEELRAALEDVAGRSVRLRRMSLLPLRLAAPVWPMGRHLVEMSYLWRIPHYLDGAAFRTALPDFRETPLEVALASAIRHQIHPDEAVAGGGAHRVERRAA